MKKRGGRTTTTSRWDLQDLLARDSVVHNGDLRPLQPDVTKEGESVLHALESYVQQHQQHHEAAEHPLLEQYAQLAEALKQENADGIRTAIQNIEQIFASQEHGEQELQLADVTPIIFASVYAHTVNQMQLIRQWPELRQQQKIFQKMLQELHRLHSLGEEQNIQRAFAELQKIRKQIEEIEIHAIHARTRKPTRHDATVSAAA